MATSAPAHAAQAAPVSSAPLVTDLADLKDQAATLKEKAGSANNKLAEADEILTKASGVLAKATERQESAKGRLSNATTDATSARRELGMVQFGANLARTIENRATLTESSEQRDDHGLLGIASITEMAEQPSLLNLTLEASAAERDATISAIQAEWAGAGARAELRVASRDVVAAQAKADEAAKVQQTAANSADKARSELSKVEAEVNKAEEAKRAAERKAAAEKAARDANRIVKPGTGHTTSPYGMRTHPITGVYKLHSGTDFSYGDGTAYAAKAGTVAAVTYDGAYGNMVTISHGGGLQTRYAHLSQPKVGVGQKVSAGSVVGNLGATGYATGPHLHFEVLKNGGFVNADSWLGQ